MYVDAIRSLLHRRPFVPFELRLSDGRTIVVRHPDMLVLNPGGTTASTFLGFEQLTVIPLDRVTALETIPSRPAPGGHPRPTR